MSKNGLCKHELHGVLCHKCHPETHTYLAILKEKAGKGQVLKTFTAPGFAKAVAMGERMGALEVFHRIYPNTAPKEPAEAKEPIEEEV